jgi:hypothetical protein
MTDSTEVVMTTEVAVPEVGAEVCWLAPAEEVMEKPQLDMTSKISMGY